MSELHRTDQNLVAERVFADLSDAEVIACIRAGAPTAYPATQEFRRRHHPAVLAYACLYGRDHSAAGKLAARAFALATQEVLHGIDPQGTWRHRLLVLVQQAALTWATGSSRSQLVPGFVTWLDDTGGVASDRAVPIGLQPQDGTVLSGFHRLPERLRGVLWHAVVEEEPDAEVATLLGIEPGALNGMKAPAQEAMRQACLRAHPERGGYGSCQGYQRLIEAAARPGDMRHSEDLDRHLAGCPRCATAFTVLIRMQEDVRAALADGLLGWGAAEYLAAGPFHGVAALGGERQVRPALPAPLAAPTPRPEPGKPDQWRTWRAVGSFALAMTATALVAALVAAYGDPTLLDSSAGSRPGSVNATATVTSTTTASVTVTPPQPTSASPVPAPSMTQPAPTWPSSPSQNVATSPVVTAWGRGYAQVVDVGSGLCLDIRDGIAADHTDVVANPCDASDTQQWRLDSRGLLRTAADPGFCLDSRGSTDRGVGIWSCSSIDGDHGRNLVFAIDSAGVIRPRIAPGFAVTPSAPTPGNPLVLSRFAGRTDQHWVAGYPPAN